MYKGRVTEQIRLEDLTKLSEKVQQCIGHDGAILSVQFADQLYCQSDKVCPYQSGQRDELAPDDGYVCTRQRYRLVGVGGEGCWK